MQQLTLNSIVEYAGQDYVIIVLTRTVVTLRSVADGKLVIGCNANSPLLKTKQTKEACDGRQNVHAF